MNNYQVMMTVLRTVQNRDAAWEAMKLVWAYLDGHLTREETEAEMDGLCDDPAALLEKVTA